MPTGLLKDSSILVRQKWVMEGIIQAASKGFWPAFTGTSSSSMICQKNIPLGKEGLIVNFDFSGNLTQPPVKNKQTAYGRGEEKRKFSDKVTINRYRQVVDNGDKFDAVKIGDTSLFDHADSRNKLSDLFIRVKDQAIYDCLTGILNDPWGSSQPASHVIDLGQSFTFNDLIKIESILTSSRGFTTGGVRIPLMPYSSNSSSSSSTGTWYLIADNLLINKLRADAAYQNIIKESDMRGEMNRNIKGYVGKIGNIRIIDAPLFFGSTDKSGTFGIEHSYVERSGMRQWHVDPDNADNKIWTGQPGFDYEHDNLHSRALLLGQAAVQFGYGGMPDYKVQSSQDFGITTESCLESYWDLKKVKLSIENSDYEMAKVSGFDYGVVCVDVEI